MYFVIIVITNGDFMSLFSKIKSLFKRKTKSTQKIVATPIQTTNIVEKQEYINTYTDIWQYIKPKENTQAEHILSVVSFDDWQDMDDIRKAIKNKFFIEYKHEKSLYPYIKTLVDIGLLEISSVGGKRKWKKKELSIKSHPILKSV